MYPSGYIAEVTSLSPRATEEDVHNFFAYCGAVKHVEIIRHEGHACRAYVTFRDAYALETAVLLSGATILDQTVCISWWGMYFDEPNDSNSHSENTHENYSITATHADAFATSPAEAATVAQEVVKTMIAKGYVLSRDAFVKAKAFDESHNLSTTAANKFADLSRRIGLTQHIYSSMETVKSADEKYHFSDFTKSAVLVTGTAAVTVATITGRAATAAATAVANSSYFAKGALWVSDALGRAAKAAGDLGSQTRK